MFFLSFLLFSSLYVDGENYIKIYKSSHEMDMFFIEKGFFNPAGGLGIIGAELNPASLGKIPDVQFLTAVSLNGISSVDIDTFSFEVEDDNRSLTDSVFVNTGSRVYGQYSALGGINYIGFAKRFGMFGFGISYGSGYKLGVEASLDGNVYGYIDADEAFDFTSDDFSEISGDDTISVNPLFKGAVTLDNPVPLKIEYSDYPIFFGGGIGIGPVAFGTGLKFQNCRIVGEGSFSARIDSLVMEVNDTTVIDGDGDEWIIEDFSAALDFDEDFANADISSSGLSTTHPVFSLGMLLDEEFLKLSFGFDFGPTYDLMGNYSWAFSSVSDLPDSFVSVDSSNLTIIQDSLITGRAVIVIDSMIRDGESEFDDEGLSVAGSSFNFGFIIEPMNLGISGKLSFPGDYSLSKVSLYTYAPIPVPVVDVRLGLAADVLLLTGYEVDGTIFIPSATLGLSLGYERDYLKFYLPIKYDVSHIASSIVGGIVDDVSEDEEVFFDINSSSSIWDNLAFGLGFSVKM